MTIRGFTHVDPGPRLPPLRPFAQRRIYAVSCLKEGHWLIRAWGTGNQPGKYIKGILAYTGRLDLTGLEWWGYSYGGLPYWLPRVEVERPYGMSIQRYAPPDDKFILKMIDEGKTGMAYGPIEELEVPEGLHW